MRLLRWFVFRRRAEILYTHPSVLEGGAHTSRWLPISNTIWPCKCRQKSVKHRHFDPSTIAWNVKINIPGKLILTLTTVLHCARVRRSRLAVLSILDWYHWPIGDCNDLLNFEIRNLISLRCYSLSRTRLWITLNFRNPTKMSKTKVRRKSAREIREILHARIG